MYKIKELNRLNSISEYNPLLCLMQMMIKTTKEDLAINIGIKAKLQDLGRLHNVY